MQFWKFSTLAIAALLPSMSLVSASGDLDSAAVAPGDSAVLQLTAKNFEQALVDNPLILVEFYAPWCGHCKALGPEYVKAADELKEKLPEAKLGQVNCVENEELCRQRDVKGYPALKLAGVSFQQPVDYEGPRDSENIVGFMVKMSQPPVSIVSDIADFVKTGKAELKPYVVQILPQAAHAAAAKFNETFGEIAHLQRISRSHFLLESDETIAEFGKLINVDISGDKAKYLLIHPNELNDVRLYDGEDFTSGLFDDWVANAQVPDFGDINRDTYMTYIHVTLPLAYFFYNNSDQRAEYADFFVKKSKELRGKLSFVGLDATQFGRHAEILNMNPDIVPLFAIQDNTNGRKYGINQTEHPVPSLKTIETFIGDFLARKIDPIIKSEPLPTPEDKDYDENVVKLVAHNYDDLLADESKNIVVKYFAPWCGHCKKLAPIWTDLGAHYKDSDDSVVIAKIDHTLNDVSVSHNIEGYPTIVLYQANGEKDPKTGLRRGVVFDKTRDFESLKEFIEATKITGTGAGKGMDVKDDEDHDEL